MVSPMKYLAIVAVAVAAAGLIGLAQSHVSSGKITNMQSTLINQINCTQIGEFQGEFQCISQVNETIVINATTHYIYENETEVETLGEN
ncbi:MAG: hypothetical protein ACP5L1_06550 [Caldivirga sp.]|uniref:hypothetical protein n=1 Tax=Caldivirga sp. TaxID=2080243 RepID=UPI003D148903